MEWPPGTIPLQDYHKAYLAGRGYDPDFLETKYKLMGTVNAGSYAGRIMAPIFLDGIWVSYQGRDITGRAELRYKACKKELELINHKTILYNIDNAKDTGIVVEGIFDVWRFGDRAIGVIGTSITPPQVRMAAERFKKVFIIFDVEAPAQRKARWLRDQLSVIGIKTINIILEKGDPADMSQEKANQLKKELLE